MVSSPQPDTVLDAVPDAQRQPLARALALHGVREVRSFQRTSGQFNTVVIVNDELVFRLPRSPVAAEILTREKTVLRALRGRLPIPAPDPLDMPPTDACDVIHMAYPLLPGVPLTRSIVDEIADDDPDALKCMARQLGAFLRTLHSLSPAELAIDLPAADIASEWRRLLEAFRRELFSHLRPDACLDIELRFSSFLGERANLQWRQVVRHGDFGGTNLLCDIRARRVTGVIDFSSIALGDPAVDLASISAFHQRFANAMRPAYPDLFSAASVRRATFYRGTFALQQALWALRTGDEAEFNDGVAAYV